MIKTTVVNIAGAAAEIYPHVCRHQIFGKDAKEDSHFDKKYWKYWISTYNKRLFNSYHLPYVKTNSKRIIEINVKAEAIKSFRENRKFFLLLFWIREKFNPTKKHDVKKIINWACIKFLLLKRQF